MTKMSNIITCPHCLKSFDKTELGIAKDRKMMAVLVEEGFGLREIGRRFNEHPETVKYWHKKYLQEGATTKDYPPKPVNPESERGSDGKD